jgi:excinuclease UvrABC helicase subunit UvrB
MIFVKKYLMQLSWTIKGSVKSVQLDISGSIADFRKAAQLFRKQGKTQKLKFTIELLRKLGVTEN